MGDCLLCGAADVKLAKSHIIPKSLYAETLKSEEGPARIVSGDKDFHPRRSPMGVYDSEILCIACEESLSPLDDYAHELFMQKCAQDAFHIEGKPMAGKHDGVDIEKLMMFFISLVWRMQVTKQPMFSGMKLGPYEKKVKKALLDRDPGIVPELDVVISKFDDETSAAFMGPTPLRMEGVNGYRVGFAYHLCWVKVDKRAFPYPFHSIRLSKGNPLYILYREFADSPERRAMVETVKSNN